MAQISKLAVLAGRDLFCQAVRVLVPILLWCGTVPAAKASMILKYSRTLRFALPVLALLFCAFKTHAQITVTPALPTIPAAVYYVTNYGAISDGVTTNTTAINNAIADANTTTSGGTIEIPYVPGTPNVYLSGPIKLKNKMNLQVDAGVTLRMLPYHTWTNVASGDFISAGSNPSDVEISGSGTIDGQATLSDWWSISSTSGKPYMINLSHGARIWIRNVTLTRPPKMHIDIGSGSTTDVTIDGITINTDSGDSHNTDGIDLSGHNILIENSSISDGDDNIAITSTASGIVITNCTFGAGHGTSIGGTTGPGGVSNLLIINCTYNGTDNPIRIKSDNGIHGSSSVDGGICQNLYYLNLTMTNVNNAAIMIYAYYNVVGTPTSITPATAASETVDPIANPSLTPFYENIVISNVNATVSSGGIAGIIWGRTELPATNILLSHVNITAQKTFDVYNAYGVQFVDSHINTTTSGQKTFALWNTGIIVTNSFLTTNLVVFDGLGGNTNSSIALYNSRASLTSTDLFGANPLTLSGCVLTNTGNLTFSNDDVVNFALGTNASAVVVSGNLNLRGTLNIAGAPGFTATNYTVFTYSGTLANLPVLGSTPHLNSYLYSLNTGTPGQVRLIVTQPSPPNFGNIQVVPAGNGSLVIAGSGGVTNGTYYVLTSTNLTQWTAVATNPFDASGNFIFTNLPAPNSPQTFYRLQLP